MSTIKKGMLAQAGEWAKHLRPRGKRLFWGKERVAIRAAIREELFGVDLSSDFDESTLPEDADVDVIEPFKDVSDSVFVAERGYDYEGFQILGIFRTAEEAEKACMEDYTEYMFGRRMNGDYHGIGQYVIGKGEGHFENGKCNPACIGYKILKGWWHY